MSDKVRTIDDILIDFGLELYSLGFKRTDEPGSCGQILFNHVKTELAAWLKQEVIGEDIPLFDDAEVMKVSSVDWSGYNKDCATINRHLSLQRAKIDDLLKSEDPHAKIPPQP